jgi:N-acetylneuraminate synthase
MDNTFVIAEIGINHNGDMKIVKKLIDGAKKAGCDAVKFQKRTIETVYTKEELDKDRESPWGTTNRQQKLGLEFEKAEYDEIDQYCKEKKIDWLASAWDLNSQEFLKQYDLKYNKIASAMLTHRELIEMVAKEGKYTFISTGMSTTEEIDSAVAIFKEADCPFEIMHCNSSYPMKEDQANLRCIEFLRERYNCKVGYSGHEVGLIISVGAVALGATSVERHITLDRSMYGSDQSASVELNGLARLVEYIRGIELSLGIKDKIVYEEELQAKSKLRKVDTLKTA